MIVHPKVSHRQNEILVCEHMVNSPFLLNILESRQWVRKEYTIWLEAYSSR